MGRDDALIHVVVSRRAAGIVSMLRIIVNVLKAALKSYLKAGSRSIPYIAR